VLFPFGHGLSYTSFAYRDLALNQTGGTVTVTFKVKNSGTAAGKETAQVYVRDVQSTVFRPEKELKGFAKVELAPGEEKEISISLNRRAFSFYDTGSKEWVVEPGEFEILVGASSRDIRLKAAVHLASGQGTVSPVDKACLASYYQPVKGGGFSLEEFEALLGHPVPANIPPQKGQYSMTTPMSDMAGTLVGGRLYQGIRKGMLKMVAGKEETPSGALMIAMSKEMPMRSMMMFGGLSQKKLEAMLLMINGHYLKGLVALVKKK
jgi:beta-glucosidase